MKRCRLGIHGVQGVRFPNGVRASDGGVFGPVSAAAPLNLTEPDDGSALIPFGRHCRSHALSLRSGDGAHGKRARLIAVSSSPTVSSSPPSRWRRSGTPEAMRRRAIASRRRCQVDTAIRIAVPWLASPPPAAGSARGHTCQQASMSPRLRVRVQPTGRPAQALHRGAQRTPAR
jgi:hypothetical protein